jgi:hypothetical protein
MSVGMSRFRRGAGSPVVGRALAAASVLLATPACARGLDEGGSFDWGPVAARYVDVNGERRLKGLGPFFESAVSPEGRRVWAFRPLYASARDPESRRRVYDVAWPIAGGLRLGDERSFRFLTAFYRDFDVTEPKSRYHVRVWPVYFQGRDAQGRSYLGIFPLGGRIHEFLGRDEIAFFLFPLTMYSSINEVRSYEFLWPLIARSEGKGIGRFRIAPFYGYAKHRDRFEKRFVLWPFWTWARYKYPNASGRGYVVFPLWGHIKLQDQETWFVVPPLFRFSRGARMNYSHYPWPLLQRSEGEVEKFYVWPLFGKKRMRGVRSSFFLWPIFRTEQVDRGDVVGRRFVAMPFIQSEVRKQRPREAGGTWRPVARCHKVWPLVSFRQEGEARRIRVLDLWPLWDSGPVERSWAPLWTVVSHVTVGEATDDEILWGFFRHHRRGSGRRAVSLFPLFRWSRDDAAATRRWDVLMGLFGYERRGTQRAIRMLYFARFGAGKKESPP